MDKFVRNGHEGVRFFVGPEIEQTPAFGKKTLFVVGLQPTYLVEKLAREYKTPHIFLSANRSFDGLYLADSGVYEVPGPLGTSNAADWEKQIHALLDLGFMVSLDYPAHKHAMVLKVLNAGIWQSRNFVPVLSVAVPHVSTTSVNLTIKIDDSNFKATNPGVWCMNHHEVTDSNRFTGWGEYNDDFVVPQLVIEKFETPVLAQTSSKKAVLDNPATPANEASPIGVGAPEVEKATPMPPYVTPTKESVEHINLKDLVPLVAEDKNDTTLGLDPDGKSRLKPDANETVSEVVTVTTPASAAEAYAEGAKEDPLGKESSKKPTSKKKV